MTKKDCLVSNYRLSRATIDSGLDKFIVAKAFTGYKWRPYYVGNLLVALVNGKWKLSSKVLADVVKALIGAAMINGGIPKALLCLQVFLPELQWQKIEICRDSLRLNYSDFNHTLGCSLCNTGPGSVFKL